MHKINGFNRKFHSYQIISYVFFLTLLLVYYFIVFPLSTLRLKIIGGTITGIAIIFVAVSGYIVTKTDPSDPYLQEYRKARCENQTYNPPEKPFYCTSDHTYVKTSSKHCKRCGRCVEEFDHHCKWINNDVGKANYRSFFVMITSVMILLATYLVCSIIVTVDYAMDPQLLENDIFLYGSDRDHLLGPLVIMWIFMGLSAVFLTLDTNLVLFHVFLISKGLTTFQYIAAVEERKEFRKELEYAIKILGGRKKTCLDFVLCLKKRPNKGEGKSAKPQETQRGEPEVPSITPNETNNMSDFLKKPTDKPTSGFIHHSNSEDLKESDTSSPDLFKTHRRNIDPSEKDDGNEPEKHLQNPESEIGVQPLVLKIERDQDRKKTGNHKIFTDNFVKTTTQGLLTGDMSLDSTLIKEKKDLVEDGGPTTPKKKAWQDHLCLEISQEHEDGDDMKPKTTHIFSVNHPKALTYSVKKERPIILNAQTETDRSYHIPLPNLKESVKKSQEIDSQRFDRHRKSAREALNELNDIATETVLPSVAGAV